MCDSIFMVLQLLLIYSLIFCNMEEVYLKLCLPEKNCCICNNTKKSDKPPLPQAHVQHMLYSI